MMTLEEAIQHCREKANGSCACADDHRQLAGWLVELKSRREENDGEWEKATTFTVEETSIDTLQQMRCSVCKRWHTEPYIYYVTPSNYCPNCGAKMKKG